VVGWTGPVGVTKKGVKPLTLEVSSGILGEGVDKCLHLWLAIAASLHLDW
jgi:hypothetical protein